MIRKWTLSALALAVGLIAPIGQAWHEGDGRWHTFNMVQIGYNAEVAHFPGGLTDIVLQGDHAYLGSFLSEEGLFIVDVWLPQRPELVGRLPLPDSRVNSVAVNEAGTIAVLSNEPNAFGPEADPADSFAGIAVVDVSDKTRPELIARLPLSYQGRSQAVHRVALHGNYAYLATYDLGAEDHEAEGEEEAPSGNASPMGLVIVDLSNPQRPEIVATAPVPLVEELEFPEHLQDPTVFLHDVSIYESRAGRVFAVLSAWDAGVLLYDVTVPADPLLVSEWRDMEPGFLNVHGARISPDGNLLVLGPESGQGFTGFLTFLDVSDIREPKLLTTWARPGPVWQAEGAAPPFSWTYHFFSFSEDSSKLLVAAYGSGVWALNVEDPARPRIVGSFGPESFNQEIPEEARSPIIPAIPMAWSAQYHDGLIYVSDFNSGLYVLDLVEDDPWNGSR